MGETPNLDLGDQGGLPGRDGTLGASRRKEGITVPMWALTREQTCLMRPWQFHLKDKDHPGPHLLGKSHENGCWTGHKEIKQMWLSLPLRDHLLVGKMDG